MRFRHILGAVLPSAVLLLFASGLVVASPAARATTTVRHVELVPVASGGARLTLELSGKVQRKLLTLDNPRRLVIDLPATRLAPGLHLPAGAGPVRALRAGAQPHQTLRLVLQLKDASPAHASLTGGRGGYRLIVDLGRGARSAAPYTSPSPEEEASRAVQAGPLEASLPAGAEPQVAALRPAHAPPNSGRDIIIAIDAGHGGQDPGATGHGGTHEKDVVLAIARALARRVDSEPGMKAYLTRDSDRFLVLRDRIDRSREARADLFVSIHADSIANRAVSGSSVYVLSAHGASSEAARWLANRENAADLKGGISLSDKNGQLASVLVDLSQTASIGSSMEAAERVLASLDRVGDVRKSQVQQAGFVVLKSRDIPAMLVETAYISNPAEEARLRTSVHQEAIANAIFAGLREYFRKSPPDGTQYALRKGRGGGPIMAAGAP